MRARIIVTFIFIYLDCRQEVKATAVCDVKSRLAGDTVVLGGRNDGFLAGVVVLCVRGIIDRNLCSDNEEDLFMSKKDVPIWEKSNLTLEEAAAYSGIGINKIRELTDDEDCEFVLWIGRKRMIKRKKFDEYIEKRYSI